MMTEFFKLVTFFGSFWWLSGATVLIVIWLYSRNRKDDAKLFAAIMAVSPIIEYGLKYLIKEPRPLGHQLVVETSYSFPSGHSLNSMVFYLLAMHFFRIKNKWLVAAIILTIGYSRIYLGVHYPRDVVGGFIIGYLIYALGLFLGNKRSRKK